MMKIHFKTLQNKKLLVDAEENDKVVDLKRKLFNEHKVGPIANQKLIFKGNILKDEQTFLKEFDVKPTDFIIVMITKKPKTPPPSKPARNVTQNDAQPTISASSLNNRSLSNQNNQTDLNNAQNSENLRNNPQNAQNSSNNAQNPPNNSQNSPNSGNNSSNALENESGEMRNFNNFQSSPINFEVPLQNRGDSSSRQINRNILIEQLSDLGIPQQSIMNALSRADNNPQRAFEILISELDRLPRNFSESNLMMGLRDIDEQGSDDISIRAELTQQDVEAIDRLQNLGFSRVHCLQMYMACDKNEMLAANLLCEDVSSDVQNPQDEHFDSEEDEPDNHDESESEERDGEGEGE